MRHNKPAYQARRDSPARRPSVLLRAALGKVFYVACLRKILPKKMRRSSLQSFSILHHCLYAICVDSPWEFFTFCFLAAYYGHCHVFLRKLFVHAEHFFGFNLGFFAGGVRRMPLLPEEFRRAQK